MDLTPSTSASSRFVTESSIVEAQERRKEEWKKAFERLGQKPPDNEAGPPQVYDPRSLYEKLQEQKDSKQAAFDDKYSIRNQFRGVDDDEISFLDSVLDDKKLAEKERQREIDGELAKFRQAVSEKQISSEPPLVGSPPVPLSSVSPTSNFNVSPSASTSAIPGTTKAPPPAKRSSFQQKGLLAGAIKRKTSGGEKDKKKPSATDKLTTATSVAGSEGNHAATKGSESSLVLKVGEEEEKGRKKRKVDSSL